MKEGWKIVEFGELCDEITVGFVGPMANEYVDEGILFLRSQNINAFRLNLSPSQTKYISPAFHKKLKKSKLRAGDIAIVRTGYPGTACVIPEGLGEANCSDLVVARPKKDVDAYFICNYINSPFGFATINGSVVGSAQKHFNVGVAKRLKIPLPPLHAQRKIASILSAYDNLIENNLQRIKLLEELAQRTYEEWFVKFRVNGEQLEVDGESGLPLGWEKKKLKELCTSLDYGFTASASSEPIGPKFLRITDIVPTLIEWDSVPYCEVPEKKTNQYLLRCCDCQNWCYCWIRQANQ
jgi:type I restriction enzyme S subunit